MITLLEIANRKYEDFEIPFKSAFLQTWLKSQGFTESQAQESQAQEYILKPELKCELRIVFYREYFYVYPKVFLPKRNTWNNIASEKVWFAEHPSEKLIQIVENIALSIIDEATV